MSKRHELTTEQRQRGQAKGAASKRARREEERQELAAIRHERLDRAIERLASAAERAATVIEELLEAESETIRLRSAVALLEILDVAETRELAARLERLEALASANGHRA